MSNINRKTGRHKENSMVCEKMLALGNTRSVIRELFEFGINRAALIGQENVYDFSIGNPSIPPPPQVERAIIKAIENEAPLGIHGYTSAAGSALCRQAVADNLNKRFGKQYTPQNLIITCGAAPALVACFRALSADVQSEFIALAPYFPEYKVFVEQAGARLRILPADTENFQIDVQALREMLTPETQAVIVSSPNNPSGVVYDSKTVQALSTMLSEASELYGHPIYIISDEPYREIIYSGVKLPFIPDYYKETIICYSYSKCLSIPGERIGYVLVPDQLGDFRSVYDSVAGALRASGHVCAPSLMQRVITECADVLPDVTVYERNARLIYDGLTRLGYRCVRPDGAFYLFFEAPFGLSAREFSDLAKDGYNVLIVPGDGFGCPNYLRLSFCVDTARLVGAIPLFERMYAAAKACATTK